MNEQEARGLEARINEEAPNLKTRIEQKWVVRVENSEGFWRDMRFVAEWEDAGVNLGIYNSNWPK